MRFLVLGATGATGALFTQAALEAGHEVSALVRSPEKLPRHHRLRAVAGDVRDANALASAGRDADALVSMLGVRKPRRPEGLIADSARAAIAAAALGGPSRVLVQSAFGVGASYAKASVVMRLGYHAGRPMFRDKEEAEVLWRASDLDWTFAYPGMLTDGPRTAGPTASDLDALPYMTLLPRVSRADVAGFLLAAATDGGWSRRVAVLTT